MRKFLAARVSLFVVVLLLLNSFALPADAAANLKINYQGKIEVLNGQNPSFAEYPMVFNLYTQLTGGSPIWTESWVLNEETLEDNRIGASNGLFSVMLGELNSLASVDFNQTLYLGVTVGSDSEMSPRKVLGTVPSAFEAQKLQGYSPSDFLMVGGPYGDLIDYGITGTSGVRNVYVSGKYVYVANESAGLKIMDISNPASPALVGTYNTSGFAYDVIVSGKYAYVADGGSGLQIIDVSNPASPALVGNYDTPASVLSLYVSGKYAYLADFNSANLLIIDVSNPASPSLAGTFHGTYDVLSVYVSGKYAYVAEQLEGLKIIDISNPARPSLVGTYDTSGYANDVYVSGKYAYVTDDTAGLQVINIANPASPSLVGTYNTPGTASSVYVSGQYAYVGDGTNGLVVVDVSTPAAPVLAATSAAADNTNFYGVYVFGKYVYASDNNHGLHTFGTKGLDTPSIQTGSINTSLLNVGENINVGGDIFTGGGLNIGISGLFSRGVISSYVASSTAAIPVSATFMGGNVGVGTTTPYAALSVAGNSVITGLLDVLATGNSTSTFSANLWVKGNLRTTGATYTGDLVFANNFRFTEGDLETTPQALILQNQSGDTLAKFSDDGKMEVFGSLYANDVNIANSDLAENYPTADQTLTSGEIVALDPEQPESIKRAALGDMILGVISTKPGLLLGKDLAESRPVALTGRVPVKVSLEGGEIKIGDYLTISSQPGIASKATSSATTIVGMALAPLGGEATSTASTTSSIPMFVMTSMRPMSDQIHAGKIASFFDFDAATGRLISLAPWDLNNQEIKNVRAIFGAKGVWSIDESGMLTAPEIHTNKLCLGSTCIDEGQLQSILNQTSLSGTAPTPPTAPSETSTVATTTPEEVIPTSTSTEPVIEDPVLPEAPPDDPEPDPAPQAGSEPELPLNKAPEPVI